MLSGEFYDTRDSELRRLSSNAKDIMRAYNSLPAETWNYEIKSFACCLALAAIMSVSINLYLLTTVVIFLLGTIAL